jgi:hypothetical protein
MDGDGPLRKDEENEGRTSERLGTDSLQHTRGARKGRKGSDFFYALSCQLLLLLTE